MYFEFHWTNGMSCHFAKGMSTKWMNKDDKHRRETQSVIILYEFACAILEWFIVCVFMILIRSRIPWMGHWDTHAAIISVICRRRINWIYSKLINYSDFIFINL